MSKSSRRNLKLVFRVPSGSTWQLILVAALSKRLCKRMVPVLQQLTKGLKIALFGLSADSLMDVALHVQASLTCAS